MPLIETHKTVYRDLCTLCIHSKWLWVAIHRRLGNEEIIDHYELGKLCYNPKHCSKFHPHRILTLKKSCPHFQNSTMNGFSPNPNNFREVIGKMPKLDVSIAEANEPIEGKTYKIVKTELTTTDIRSYSACRVTLNEVDKKGAVVVDEDKKPVEAVTMLWLREQAGAKSKIGSFLNAFKEFFDGSEFEDQHDNSDLWVDHIVKVSKWQERQRELKVLS